MGTDTQELEFRLKRNLLGEGAGIQIIAPSKEENVSPKKPCQAFRSDERIPGDKISRLEPERKNEDGLIKKMRQALGEPKKYEQVNHPKHYNNYDIEVIEMMQRIWGLNATILFCEMNAFKYRMRLGLKPENSVDQDLDKEKWYLNKAKELKAMVFDKTAQKMMND